MADGRERPDRVAESLPEVRLDRELPLGPEHQRVTVGLRGRAGVEGEDTGRAADIVDGHRLLELDGELVREGPRHDIDYIARRERHDELERPRRIHLRRRRGADQRRERQDRQTDQGMHVPPPYPPRIDSPSTATSLSTSERASDRPPTWPSSSRPSHPRSGAALTRSDGRHPAKLAQHRRDGIQCGCRMQTREEGNGGDNGAGTRDYTHTPAFAGRRVGGCRGRCARRSGDRTGSAENLRARARLVARGVVLAPRRRPAQEAGPGTGRSCSRSMTFSQRVLVARFVIYASPRAGILRSVATSMPRNI